MDMSLYSLQLCQLDDQILGSYPSQMFVLMVVHYLQQLNPPVLPIPPKVGVAVASLLFVIMCTFLWICNQFKIVCHNY